MILDFSSSLYLDLDHGSQTLMPWKQLTYGKPGLLYKPSTQYRVEKKLARLMGSEQAMLGTSTLHLFWDLFGWLSTMPVSVYFDEHIYPIARWAVERCAYRKLTVRMFAHHNTRHLGDQLAKDRNLGLKPLVVIDGFCPGCGRWAPLPGLLDMVRLADGLLIVDDTQAFGIYGQPGHYPNQFGYGGGGSLRWHGIQDDRVICINSLAKAFGAPVAVLGGNAMLLEKLSQQGETLMHCSPPNTAAIHAAYGALDINRNRGDVLRQQLQQRVNTFRAMFSAYGIPLKPGNFPVQSVLLPQSKELYKHMQQAGIKTVFHRLRCQNRSAVSFIITAGQCVHTYQHVIAVMDDFIETHPVEIPWEVDYV